MFNNTNISDFSYINASSYDLHFPTCILIIVRRITIGHACCVFKYYSFVHNVELSSIFFEQPNFKHITCSFCEFIQIGSTYYAHNPDFVWSLLAINFTYIFDEKDAYSILETKTKTKMMQTDEFFTFISWDKTSWLRQKGPMINRTLKNASINFGYWS